jgi:hypothetical protein
MLQPVVVPVDSPRRTCASHEFERAEPFQVKVRLCVCATLLERRSMVAVAALVVKVVFASPPPLPMSPGLEVVRLPEVNAMLVLAVTPLTWAWPSQPEASLERPMSPMKVVLMVRR